MSSPWKFFGTWLPLMESVLSAVTPTGSGTAYPLLWNRTDGSTAANQICQFEWTTKAISFSAAGSATCTFTNPTSGGTPATATATASYSITASALDSLGTTGTDWSVLEPPDISSGGRSWTIIGTQTVPVTLPWPSTGEAIVFTVEVDVGSGFGTLAIDGTGFVDYVKPTRIAVSANSALLTSNKADFISPVFVSAFTVLHGSVDMFQDTGVTDTVTLSGSVSVASKFTQPPNI